jgi:hypothetical protein
LAQGCTHTNNTHACDDGNACTANDTCAAGACVAGPAVVCADGLACTADSCDPASGCVNSAANFDTAGFSANRVDGLDLVILANAWNSCPGDTRYNVEVNLDHSATLAGSCVDMTDFHLFMTTFGQICP